MENLSRETTPTILLALETTDTQASVALYREGEIRQRVIDSVQRHAETVMPAVEELLEQEGLTTQTLTGLAVDVGPGSFTGVRIGVCHANAIAYALGIPVVSVDALKALAFPHLGQGKPVCALIDARNGNGYGALYADNGEALIPPRPCVVEEFLKEIPAEALCTGSGYPEGVDFVPAQPRAESIARLGVVELKHTPVGAEARPLYLRQSQAERNRKQG